MGVDLASAAKRTATCVIEWADGRASVRELVVVADDDAITSLAAHADAVGIDAPFGWPAPFVELLTGKPRLDEWTHKQRDALCFRETDHYIRRETGRWPLSVSSDRIGVVAMRCRGLLQRLREADPAALKAVFEVYPAAALRRWGLVDRSYKGAKRRAALVQLVGKLSAVASWLDVPAEHGELLRSSDDAFDALVASLVARAARVGLTDELPDDSCTRSEGWIELPKEGSLSALAM
ncbi:MAG TPA: DUF429 domain-containing protein [Planctomycetota bacterium]|nr:DUF429 domain-containing protein [Planctomycetota bacterium]